MSALAVHARLAAARLLHVVDRVAAAHDTTSGALLTVTGRVSPAQAALFRALAAERQDAAGIAKLLGWGEAAVVKAIGLPEPRPTPAPESGVRPADLRRLIAAEVDKAVAPLRVEIAALQDALLARTLAEPRGPAAPMAIVRAILAKHGVPLEDLLGGGRSVTLVAVREEVVAALTKKGLSQPEIGRLLHRDRTTVMHAQRKAGVQSVHTQRRKAAA